MHPTLIRVGEFRLATYGLLVAAGYLSAILWLGTQRERMGLGEKDFWGLIYSLFFGAIAGGKLLYWAIEWRAIASGALNPILDFRYGFVFFGGFLGAAGAAWLFRRRVRFDFLKAADPFAVALPIGHAIGRLGCFAAGCCAGKPTSRPWGVRFTHPESLIDPVHFGVPVHPTQIYEFAANLLIAGLLYRVLLRVRAGSLPEGSAFAGYAVLYGIARFVLEFFRGDDRGGFLLALSVSQWVSVFVFCAAAASWVFLLRRKEAR